MSSAPAYGGPDKASAKRTVKCRDKAGHEATDAFTFGYDDTPPTVKAVPGRKPDRHGWYSHAVRIAFAGTDSVSHIDRCSSVSYRHPNSPRASVTGSCRDRAGNETLRTFRFRYSNQLLQPRAGKRVSAPPLLDWVGVPHARGYNLQLWHEGRKILTRWPVASQLKLQRRLRFQGQTHWLRRGQRYTWYVWPRFRRGYGTLFGKSRFVYVRPAARPVSGTGLT